MTHAVKDEQSVKVLVPAKTQVRFWAFMTADAEHHITVVAPDIPNSPIFDVHGKGFGPVGNGEFITGDKETELSVKIQYLDKDGKTWKLDDVKVQPIDQGPKFRGAVVGGMDYGNIAHANGVVTFIWWDNG